MSVYYDPRVENNTLRERTRGDGTSTAVFRIN